MYNYFFDKMDYGIYFLNKLLYFLNKFVKLMKIMYSFDNMDMCHQKI